MIKTTFKVDRMDCPCEERLIRMKLQGFKEIKKLEFDIKGRMLYVFHNESDTMIAKSIDDLSLGSTLIHSVEVGDDIEDKEDAEQRKSLWAVLIINLTFFFIEIITGWISLSMGLIADSLDMLADTIVYGLSLMVVGASIIKKRMVAKFSGYFQILLALLGFAEIVRRFLGASEAPQFYMMIVVSSAAMLANATSLYILQRVQKREAHIQASVIFSSNDIIINAGVIIAGLSVWLFNSKIPDLIVGAIVFFIVIKGAIRILKL